MSCKIEQLSSTLRRVSAKVENFTTDSSNLQEALTDANTTAEKLKQVEPTITNALKTVEEQMFNFNPEGTVALMSLTIIGSVLLLMGPVPALPHQADPPKRNLLLLFDTVVIRNFPLCGGHHLYHGLPYSSLWL
jgi:ABC-type transporter Mla subunit MlaD